MSLLIQETGLLIPLLEDALAMALTVLNLAAPSGIPMMGKKVLEIVLVFMETLR